MRRFRQILYNILFWAAVAAYSGWAITHCSRSRGQVLSGEVRVEVLDSAQLRVVTPARVLEWIDASGLIPIGATMGEVPIARLVELLEADPFVAHAEGWVDMEGTIHLRLTQRRPLMRLRDGYLDADGRLLPLQSHLAMRLPVVTGDWGEGENNLIFQRKLINFVEFIRRNDFWASQIEQIHVRPAAGSGLYGPDVFLTLRMGDQRIVLGQLEAARAKLEKLLAFYRSVPQEEWEKYRSVDLSYRNQIVCIEE